MKKGILITLLGLFLITAGYVVWGHLFSKQEKQSKTIDSVPKDAAIIIRSADVLSFWKNDIVKHPSWAVNQYIPAFKNLKTRIESLDSIADLSPELSTLLKNRETYISTLMTGPKNYDILYSTEISQEDLALFLAFRRKHLSNYKSITRTYNECEINDFIFAKNKRLSFAILNNVLLISETPTLVEKALLQLQSNALMSQDPIIEKLWSTIIKSSSANIFVNFDKFGELNGTFLKKNSLFLSENPLMGNWCELDLTVKDHGVFLTGLIATSDTLNHYFYALSNQSPDKLSLDKIMPTNTAYFIQNNISNKNTFFKDYLTVLDKHQRMFNYENRIKKIEEKYGEKTIENIINTLGGEWSSFITEPLNEEFTNNICFAYELNNIEEDPITINKLFSELSNDSVFTEVFQNYEIKELHNGNVLNAIFDHQTNLSSHIYYAFIENFVVFANEIGNLKHIINSYSKGNTLYKNTAFQEFSNNFPVKSNLFAYYNFRYGNKVMQGSLKKDMLKTFNTYSDSIQSWESVGFMVTGGDKLLETNAYFKYNPKIEDQTMSLYSKTLKAPITSKPTIVKNHYNGNNEILVQDEKNVLHLLTADGKQLFSLDLGEKIISEIYQVDRYKNKKLQYLFNTKSSLYLVDRNGEFVEDFPITLSSKASNGLSVFDYDKNRKYRIFLANEKNEILCFDIRGKEVQGWNKFVSSGALKNEISHLSIDGKDYLVTCNELGQIIILNRRGETRIKIIEQLPSERDYYLNKTEDINTCSFICTDSVGSVFSVSFADIKDITPIKAFTDQHKFYLADVNQDGYNDYIFVDEGTVSVFKLTKSSLFEFENGDIGHFSNIDILDNESLIIGITDESEEKTYLIDDKGQIIEGFPVDGISPMNIFDLNGDGKHELIIGDKDGNIYFYSFNN